MNKFQICAVSTIILATAILPASSVAQGHFLDSGSVMQDPVGAGILNNSGAFLSVVADSSYPSGFAVEVDCAVLIAVYERAKSEEKKAEEELADAEEEYQFWLDLYNDPEYPWDEGDQEFIDEARLELQNAVDKLAAIRGFANYVFNVATEAGCDIC